MKQTAVEWLVERYIDKIGTSVRTIMQEEIEQALEMERKQIEEAVSAGYDYCYDGKVRWVNKEYYKETYGK